MRGEGSNFSYATYRQRLLSNFVPIAFLVGTPKKIISTKSPDKFLCHKDNCLCTFITLVDLIVLQVHWIRKSVTRTKLLFYNLQPAVQWRLFTSPRTRGGVVFSLQFVCVSVYVSGYSCEQNSSRTDAPIWMRFSLNGCLSH